MAYYPNRTITELIKNRLTDRKLRKIAPYLYNIHNSYDCFNCHAYRYYFPHDGGVAGEIYIDKFYGDMFEGIGIDIGANTGISTIYALEHGASHVYSYEPNENNYSLMKDRIDYMGLSEKVTMYNMAVSDTNGYCGLCGEGAGAHVDDKSNFKVKCIRASDIIQGNISYMKIDAEGSEYPIIKDLYSHNVLDCIPVYYIEIHDMYETRGHTDEIFGMMQSAGFYNAADITLMNNPYVHMLHFRKCIGPDW